MISGIRIQNTSFYEEVNDYVGICFEHTWSSIRYYRDITHWDRDPN